ncbi:hypothetical protein C8J56DRAFT_893844 [Mycena floridula]|nr:hypothetical protein C8J56DRAFT_893844 [Mycena floridula]
MQLTQGLEALLDLDLEPPADEYRGIYQRRRPEFVWVNLQPKLEEAGYRLRPRYHRDWKPSWLPGERLAGHSSHQCEDSLSICLYWGAIDAIRVKDGQKVVLKIAFDNTKEREILQTFSEPLFRNNPRNHCVPVLDTIEFPGKQFTIIVLPFLISIRASPHCLREVINFMRQTLQGHQRTKHLMMTGGHVIPSEHHFVSFSNMYSLKSGLLVRCKPQQHLCRVSRLRYFFIDFGLSDEHPDGQEQARTTGRFGQVRVTPELSDDVPYNPFKSDILQLGRIFKDLFPLKFPDLYDFDVLADRMTKTKAEDRPNAKEALELFEEIVSSMPKRRRRARVQDEHRKPRRAQPPSFKKSMSNCFACVLEALWTVEVPDTFGVAYMTGDILFAKLELSDLLHSTIIEGPRANARFCQKIQNGSRFVE